MRSTIFDPTGEHNDLPPGIEISSRHRRFPYTSQKFLAIATGDSRGDVPYMRAAEMYLIEAEAKARQGDAAGAADALFSLASITIPFNSDWAKMKLGSQINIYNRCLTFN